MPKIYPGLMVLYRCRPGQVRAGQQDLAAMVTRVWPDGTASLRIYVPDSPDVILQSRVMPMSETITSHCWRLPEGADVTDVAALKEQLAEAFDRIATLEAAKPGRPRKAVA